MLASEPPHLLHKPHRVFLGRQAISVDNDVRGDGYVVVHQHLIHLTPILQYILPAAAAWVATTNDQITVIRVWELKLWIWAL